MPARARSALEDPLFPRREHGAGRSPSDALVIDHICVGAVAALEALAPRRAPAVVCRVLDMVDIVDRHGVDEPAALVDPELPVEPAGFHPATADLDPEDDQERHQHPGGKCEHRDHPASSSAQDPGKRRPTAALARASTASTTVLL